MIFRVHLTDGEYRIVLRPEVIEALGLFEGTGVEIVKVDLDDHGFHYATTEEALASYEVTSVRHDATYRELAKGIGWIPKRSEVDETELR